MLGFLASHARRGLLSIFFLVVASGFAACGGNLAPSGGEASGTSSEAGAGGPDGALDTDGQSTAPPSEVPASFLACGPGGTCELAMPGCCGLTCGTLGLVAIGSGQTAALENATCRDPAPACPGCDQQYFPQVQAWCVAGSCEVVDLAGGPLSACTTNDDCGLHHAGCCACQTADAPVLALRKDAFTRYDEGACTGTLSCPNQAPGCTDVLPNDVAALCNTTTGHCEVRAKR